MEPLSALQIIGIVASAIIIVACMCFFDYAYRFVCVLVLPCRCMFWTCDKMRYDDEDEGVCLCDGKCIV